jgi:hypothetical protein
MLQIAKKMGLQGCKQLTALDLGISNQGAVWTAAGSNTITQRAKEHYRIYFVYLALTSRELTSPNPGTSVSIRALPREKF